jgi:hypothetical protein
MATEPTFIAPSHLEQESSRLREETLRLIGLSRTERETIDRLSPSVPPAARYRINPCGTEPESWVIERMHADGGAAEPLLLFDSQPDAQRVLDHFASRGA